VSEFHAKEPQATVSEGSYVKVPMWFKSQGSYVAARARFEFMSLRTKDIESTNEPPCPTIRCLLDQEQCFLLNESKNEIKS